MRTKKAILNASISIIYQLIAVICGLITPRLILAAFGSTYNGVISSANQFLEMISFLTLGIAGATRVALYKPIADNDTLSISRIIRSNKNYMHKVGGAVFLYAIFLSILYPFISHNDLSPVESGMLIAIVSIGVFAQYFFGITNQTLLSADQSVYVYYIIQGCALIVNTIIAVVLIKLGCSIFVVKLASSIVFLISPIVLNVVVKKKYKLIDNCEPDNTAIEQRGAVAFHSIANIIHQDTDLVILTLFTDAKLISVYTIYQLIVGKIRQILLMLTNGLEGAFGNMWAKEEYDSFEKNFRFFEYFVFSLTSIIFSCVMVLIIPFVSLYTAGVTDVNYLRYGFAILTVITEIMYCIRHPFLIVVQATGNYEATKMGAMYEAVLNIVISLTLVNFIGISGVMIGTLVANTFRTIQYSFFVSKNLIIGSIRKSSINALWFAINTLLSIVIQLGVFTLLPSISSWTSWILAGFCSISISVIITLLSSRLFYYDQLKRAISIVTSLLKRRH